MGEMAAKLVLKDVYQNKNLVINRFFEPTLMQRDSSAPLIK
jgi:LacI family transcriptional regulator